MARRVVIVTGASSGIGAACARAFSAAGYAVLAAGRDPQRTEATLAELKDARAWIGDLRKDGAAGALVAAAEAAFGRLDAVVNAAGILYRETAETTSDAQWDETLAVNAGAVFRLSRAALPALRRQGGGSLINIASDWGLRGGARAAAYCASKGAVVLLTRAMALDHAAEGIRVNAVCPGDVDTPMLSAEARQQGEDPAIALARCNAATPTGRVTTADEVAALAVFLASDAAVQITGAAIPIDGGSSA